MPDRRVLIAGGGIGGITAALCLARRAFDVTVLEQATELGEIGAGIQLSPNCTRVLHHLGLQEPLRAVAFLPEGTQFRHWRSGRVIAESALGDGVRERYGAPYYHVHRGDLLRLLAIEAGRAPTVTLRTDARVERFHQDEDGEVYAVAGGTRHHGEALVGADGIHSVVRAGLWGPTSPVFTGNVAWRALVPAERLPRGLIAPVASVWWGPRRHFVHYYVRGGTLINCVCVVEKKTTWDVESWTERGEYEELKADFAGWHPQVRQLIDAADGDALYKWALHDRPPMDRWGRGRVTLMGDACHPTLPFMAQGAAMAIEDAAVLAGCLAGDKAVDVSLKRYEDLRRARTAGVQLGSRRNARVFHLSGVQAWLRNRAARGVQNRAMHGLFGYDALTASST